MATPIVTNPGTAEYWNIVLIEDNADLVRQMEEFFAKRVIAGRRLRLLPETDWDSAFRAIKERKADLFILDIYKGPAQAGGQRIGESVLSEIRKNGFVAVVLHTNLPEGLEEHTNEFIRLVPKTAGLTALATEIESLFATKIPQMHRAIAHYLDRTLRDYMWDFVVKNWAALSEIADKPEFLRVLIQRLAISFSVSGLDAVLTEVFPEVKDHTVAEDKIHPAEFYVKPPIGNDPVLGDVRVRTVGTATEYWIVLWPTCDMVSTGGRVPKTDKALCARAKLLLTFKEYQEYTANPESGGAKKRLLALLKNARDISPDRYHFLPGLCDVPDLVVDFQDLDHPSLNDVKGWRCVASLRSPHAESLSVRFERYRNRIGTPDLDNEIVIKRFSPPAPVAVLGGTPIKSVELAKPKSDIPTDPPSE
ncbi:MAG TPA: hypothetical protein VKY85_03065 [Candidatus Angelobacter sp.]|nr:hypothetical protein [Candidatus Angelobacter sp.]